MGIGLQQFVINLENNETPFRAGDQIRGKVLISLMGNMEFRDLELKLTGEAKTQISNK